MFKVPEKYRVRFGRLATDEKHGNNGAFMLTPTRETRALNVIASDGNASTSDIKWEHVSVTLHRKQLKLPNWIEMCYVKSLFWDDEDCVIQFTLPSINTSIIILGVCICGDQLVSKCVCQTHCWLDLK